MNRLSVIIVVIMVEVARFDQEGRLLKTFSERIGDQVNACRIKSHFSSEIINEFYAYWDKDVPLDDPNMGCVIKCVLDRLELLDTTAVNENNAKAFLTANGFDEMTSTVINDLFVVCNNVSNAPDPCVASLEVALCFKTGISMIGWTPVISREEMIGGNFEEMEY